MRHRKGIVVSVLIAALSLGILPSGLAHTPPGTPGATAINGEFAGFLVPPGVPPAVVGGPWAFVGLTIVASGIFEGVPFSAEYACGAGGTRTGDAVQDSFTGGYACAPALVVLPPAAPLGGGISGFRVLNTVTFILDVPTVAVPSPDPHIAVCEGVIEPVTGLITGSCNGS